jgi:hypothetical protein
VLSGCMKPKKGTLDCQARIVLFPGQAHLCP